MLCGPGFDDGARADASLGCSAEVHAALAEIVAEYGEEALSSARAMANLLKNLLLRRRSGVSPGRQTGSGGRPGPAQAAIRPAPRQDPLGQADLPAPGYQFRAEPGKQASQHRRGADRASGPEPGHRRRRSACGRL